MQLGLEAPYGHRAGRGELAAALQLVLGDLGYIRDLGVYLEARLLLGGVRGGEFGDRRVHRGQVEDERSRGTERT